MISKIIYPAVLSYKDNDIICISFPDLNIKDEINADNYRIAIQKAEEMLKKHMLQYIDNVFSTIPKASTISKLTISADDCLVIISVDSEDVVAQLGNNCIRKTLTIPYWLNQEAKKYQINFSSVLKRALVNALQDGNNSIT